MDRRLPIAVAVLELRQPKWTQAPGGRDAAAAVMVAPCWKPCGVALAVSAATRRSTGTGASGSGRQPRESGSRRNGCRGRGGRRRRQGDLPTKPGPGGHGQGHVGPVRGTGDLNPLEDEGRRFHGKPKRGPRGGERA